MNDVQLNSEVKAIRSSQRWALWAALLFLITGILTMWSLFSGAGFIGGEVVLWVLLPCLVSAIYFERDARRRIQQLNTKLGG